jgi:hypothetical protein
MFQVYMITFGEIFSSDLAPQIKLSQGELYNCIRSWRNRHNYLYYKYTQVYQWKAEVKNYNHNKFIHLIYNKANPVATRP